MNNILNNAAAVIMIGAFIGLLALILIYTVAWFLERYDKRKRF